MGTHRQDLPFIPLGGWRKDAVCPERVQDRLWDDKVEGESEARRQARHREAKTICWTKCPVRKQCSDEVDWHVDEGIRGGHKLPSLDTQRSIADNEMLRLLRKGLTLDQAAGSMRRAG